MTVSATISQELANQIDNNALASLPAAGELKTLLNRIQALIANQDNGNGAAAGTGNVATELGLGGVRRTTLTLTDLTISVLDANAYGSQKLYDFPEGRILVLGVTGSLQFGVTTARASTINDSASLTWALGSAAASNATLSSTMVDLIPKTTKVLDGAADAYAAASTAALASSAQFDGTGTAKDAYLNVGFETGTDIDGDGTLKVSGTITITWSYLGDY